MDNVLGYMLVYHGPYDGKNCYSNENIVDAMCDDDDYFPPHFFKTEKETLEYLFEALRNSVFDNEDVVSIVPLCSQTGIVVKPTTYKLQFCLKQLRNM